jgi:hypothetical protein
MWLDEFPDLAPLTLPRSMLRPLDDRLNDALHGYGYPFAEEHINAFVEARLRTSKTFGQRLKRAQDALGEAAIVVNVRRGDYYSKPALRRQYGIDIHQHVSEALEMIAPVHGEYPRAFVVSDDVAWCQENLRDLAELQPVFPDAERNMFDDLASIACAGTLILANSTFSYWGQFISRTGPIVQRAIAPAAHEMQVDSGTPVDVLLDPTWERTSVVPGR